MSSRNVRKNFLKSRIYSNGIDSGRRKEEELETFSQKIAEITEKIKMK